MLFATTVELKIYRRVFGARGGAVCWGTALQAGMSRVRFPMGSIVNFHWRNPSGCTATLGSTQPLTEIVPGMFPGGKGGRWLGLTALIPSFVDCLEILGALISWSPKKVCPGLYRDSLTRYILTYIFHKPVVCFFFWFRADRQFVCVHIAVLVLISRLGVFSVVRSTFELCMRSVMNQQVTGMLSCWQNHKLHINKRLSVTYCHYMQ